MLPLLVFGALDVDILAEPQVLERFRRARDDARAQFAPLPLQGIRQQHAQRLRHSTREEHELQHAMSMLETLYISRYSRERTRKRACKFPLRNHCCSH
eukprot:4133238-Pyramimonas_sp.AAC.1